MKTIRQEIAAITGIFVPQGGIARSFAEMEPAGLVDFKLLCKLVVLLLEREDARESQTSGD